MVILSIDTTARGGSVAVTRDDDVLSLVPGDESRTHGERLPGEIARALNEAGLAKSAIDVIAVAAGPGPFTGLRIGLAAAQGLALTLDRPAVGVSTLDALAWMAVTVTDSSEGVSPQGSSDKPEMSSQPPPLGESGSWFHSDRLVELTSESYVAPWVDAQRGDVFAALYRVDGGRQMSDQAWTPWMLVDQAVTARPSTVLDTWSTRLQDRDALFIGNAVDRDGELIAQKGSGRWRTRLPDALSPAIARLGLRLARAGRAGKPHLLTPVYVRRPDAEIERERRRPL